MKAKSVLIGQKWAQLCHDKTKKPKKKKQSTINWHRPTTDQKDFNKSATEDGRRQQKIVL